MSGRRHTHINEIKLRWSALLLASVLSFVVIAQTEPPPDGAAGVAAAQPLDASAPAPALAQTLALLDPDAASVGDASGPAARPEPAEPWLHPDPQTSAQPQHMPQQGPAQPPSPAAAATDAQPADPGAAAASPPAAAKPNDGSGDRRIAVARNTPNNAHVQSRTVRNGDSVSKILDEFDVHSALPELASLGKKASPLFELMPGDLVQLEIRGGRLEAIRRKHDKKHVFSVRREGGSYVAEYITLRTEKRQLFASGRVDRSFYLDGLAAGLSDTIILNVVDILGWDIDFALDIRKGDTFHIVYEREYLEGEALDGITVTGVEFVNRGKAYRAARYVDSKGKVGYYSPDGRNMRKAFIRTPLEYSRISSHFNPNRLHPIFKVKRPHRGIDYAAPRGTPVYAAGDGKVVFKGRKGGYGKVIILRHGGRYSTLYAHLSRYARKLRVGATVRQKQTIGYVGSTGHSTGPHLHYEFRVHGVHKNPLTVTLPQAEPLPRAELARFRAASRATLARLDTLADNSAFAARTP